VGRGIVLHLLGWLKVVVAYRLLRLMINAVTPAEAGERLIRELGPL
jgi:hypothetical protein